MPLRDHFHNPVKAECPWTSVHATWGVKIAENLNAKIGRFDYRAHPEVHLSTQIEVDVGTFERDEPESPFAPFASNGVHEENGGGIAVAASVYAPPKAVHAAEVVFAEPDLFEVKIYRGGGLWTLVAAIELVSPSNKDREEHRRAFAIKCAAYLQKGVSVVIVDVVTGRNANLHGDLCELLHWPPALQWASPSGLAAVAYRTAKRVEKTGERVRLEQWPQPLALGEPLPTLPLWLAPDFAVPLELEATYAAACTSLLIA